MEKSIVLPPVGAPGQHVKELPCLNDIPNIIRDPDANWRGAVYEALALLSAGLIDICGEQCFTESTIDLTRPPESQALLAMISRHSMSGVFILREARLVCTSPGFQQISGRCPAELDNQELLDLVAAEDRDVVASGIVAALQEDTPSRSEYRLRDPSGRARWVVQTASRIRLQDGDAILGNVMDVTELIYLEKKVIKYEALSRLKSDLLATVSHELRTPLATIKGYATMIIDYFSRLEPEETRDFLRAIDDSTDRLSRLVDNLIDTSRLEAGMLKLRKVPTAFAPLLRSIVDEVRVRNGGHNIAVSLAERLPRVNIDSRRIRQVVDNLIDNALKYSPPGTSVTVTARRRGPDLLVGVTDEGPGIPPGELNNIFDRMYRVEKRPNASADGMGLGLYICQRLVEAHGGSIWAESAPGRGTTISFTLPVYIKAGRQAAGGGTGRPPGITSK